MPLLCSSGRLVRPLPAQRVESRVEYLRSQFGRSQARVRRIRRAFGPGRPLAAARQLGDGVQSARRDLRAVSTNCPLMDFWSGALFVVGGVVATFRSRSPRYLLLASWFWLTLLTGAVLTVDALFFAAGRHDRRRHAIFPALVLETGWRGASRLLGEAAAARPGSSPLPSWSSWRIQTTLATSSSTPRPWSRRISLPTCLGTSHR